MRNIIAIIFVMFVLKTFSQVDYFKYQFFISKAKSEFRIYDGKNDDSLICSDLLRKLYYDSAFQFVNYIHTQDLVTSARLNVIIGAFDKSEEKILQALKQGYSFKKIKKDNSIYQKLPKNYRKSIRKKKHKAEIQFIPNKKIRRKLISLIFKDQIFRNHVDTRKRDSLSVIRLNKIIVLNDNSFPKVQQVGDGVYDAFVQVVINHLTMYKSNLTYSDSLIDLFKKGHANNLNNILWNLDRLSSVNGYKIKYNGNYFYFDNDSIAYYNKNNQFRQSFGTITKMDMKTYRIFLIPVNEIEQTNMIREKLGLLPLGTSTTLIYDESEFKILFGDFSSPSKTPLK